MGIRTRYPRLSFDADAQREPHAFAIVQATRDDLLALGHTPNTAIGVRFTFVQEGANAEGESDALIFHGRIVRSVRFGLLLQADAAGVRWLSELTPDEV